MPPKDHAEQPPESPQSASDGLPLVLGGRYQWANEQRMALPKQGSHDVGRYLDLTTLNSSSPSFVAAKCYRLGAEAERERRRLRKLRWHPSVLNMEGLIRACDDRVWLLTSWMDDGTLADEANLPVSPQEADTMIPRLIDNVIDIHRSGDALGDLACENLFLAPGRRTLLIGDLDLATAVDSTGLAQGRSYYVPPREVRADQRDAYALRPW